MSLRNRLIDPEATWRMYWETLGDGRSLANLQASFPINPRTNKRVTRDAGEKAMWRWACRPENYDKAFKMLKTSMMGRGDLWTDERFQKELKEKARWCLTRRQYVNWYNASHDV